MYQKAVFSILWCVLCVYQLSFAEDIYTDVNDYIKREHSLVKPYQGVGARTGLAYWDLMGNAIATSNFVRLTPDQQSKSGAIWNTVPCGAPSWEVHVTFKVHGKGKELFGDGMVFWYARERMEYGPVFGSKDFFSGLAIFLDTYSNHNGPHNHQHPYISAMVNNGSLHYDHDKDGTHTSLDGCEAKFRNSNFDTTVAIRYEQDTLTVSTDIDNKGEWKPCFTVTGVELPTYYYFGLSATTGDLSDNHDVYSVKFFQLGDTNPEIAIKRSHIIPHARTFEPPRPRVEDKKGWSNVKIFFVILGGMILSIIAAICGKLFYDKHKENSRKRFY